MSKQGLAMDLELYFSAEILQFMQPIDSENDDKEIDSLLLAASETLEQRETLDEEIEHMQERAVPVADTKQCIGLLEAWRKHGMETTNSDIPTIADMTTHECSIG